MPELKSLRPLALLIAGLLVACATPEKACTLIGCNSGLNIAFKTAPAASYSLTLKAQGQADLSLSCPPGATTHTCFPDSVFVNNYTPATVEISYKAGDKTVTKSFTPTYTSSRPNGAGCEPECRQGKVELEI